MDVRALSLWHDQLPPRPARPALRGRVEADVAVVGAGAGFTVLWTAYDLQQDDPSLRITLVEAGVAGFGASGRNGGWCSGHTLADLVTGAETPRTTLPWVGHRSPSWEPEPPLVPSPP